MMRLLLCFVLLLSAIAAQGDDGAISEVGGAIELMGEHPSVVMARMSVTADLTPDRATVDCQFIFRNTGPTVTVRMGFPESGFGDGGGRGFLSFKTWVDGVPARATMEESKASGQAEQYLRWRVKKVQFGRGQTRRVRVRYTSRMGDDTSGARSFSYQIGTGGSWKGPIGDARVTARVTYDPLRFTLVPGEGFVRSGRRTLVWHRTSYQPEPGDSLSVRLESRRYLVHTLGSAPEAVYPGEGLRVVRGQLWVPVRELASWIGAEASTDRRRVSLLLGRRQVVVERDSPFIQVSRSRLRLALPPFVDRGQLFVPLRPIAEALGSQVSYTAARPPVVQIWRPGQREVEAAIGKQALSALDSVLVGEPGWALPETLAFSEEARQVGLIDGPRPPWLSTGDFSGDGRRDAALIVWKSNAGALLALHGRQDGSFEPVWLVPPHEPEPGSFPPRFGEVEQVLRAVHPGVIPYWQENETTPKSGRLELKHDGIEFVYLGKAATLYYWDDAAKAYRSVVSAD
ncbi:MAG: stalk domain-containing protein [Armatimonadota bacterium]